MQFLLELFEGKLQIADAVGNQGTAVKLIRAVALIDPQRTESTDLHAILRAKAQPHRA